MQDPGPRRPATRPELSGCVYAGCLLGSLPIIGFAVLAAFLGVNVLAERLVSLIPEQILAAIMGMLFLILGVVGTYAVTAGISTVGTTRRARLTALIVYIGFVLLGLPLLAFALAPSDPASRF